MTGTDRDDRRELEEFVAAIKESSRPFVDPDAVGVAANVLRDRRKLLESIAKAEGQLTTYPAVVSTPFLIWANPLGILTDSQIEPWNNRARISGSHSSGGDAYFVDSVGFYYFWQNPSAEYYALVNVISTLVTKGIVVATGNTGFLSGGQASLNAATSLVMYQRPGEPVLIPQAAQSENMYGVSAKGGGFWSGETGNIKSKGVFYEAGVEYRFLPVPPGERAYVEVRLSLQTTIFPNGSTSFDFANGDQDNYVQCPSLTVTVLSGPLTINDR